ncbi:MAG: NAD-dependent epimerase/dehydratase family protein [Alphaproteobacteria bacterium]|nr:NAD-dependent epimerase/dehydratase family protein [Alphaproteobacteria bacterium]
MIIITGASGFIGANLAGELLQQGKSLLLCDHVAPSARPTLVNHAQLLAQPFVFAKELTRVLENPPRAISALVHLGANSDTCATAGAELEYNNVTFSLELWRYCTERKIPFVHASSASTYGDGALGYDDRQDVEYHHRLKPMNPYGESKRAFDVAVLESAVLGYAPPVWIGLKFFNVYGAGELHKGLQRSVASQMLEQLPKAKILRLFRSYRDDVVDGEQKRDFVWVVDCVRALCAGLSGVAENGIYNCGHGRARSFNDLARQCFAAYQLPANIVYFDMPADIRAHYQYFTEAKMQRAAETGLLRDTTPLEIGIMRLKESLSANLEDTR